MSVFIQEDKSSLVGQKKQMDEEKKEMAASSKIIKKEQAWCYCGLRQHIKKIIACEGCEDTCPGNGWYHFECVGLTEAVVAKMGKLVPWTCAFCCGRQKEKKRSVQKHSAAAEARSGISGPVKHPVDFLCLPFLYSCFSSVFYSWDAPLLITSLLYLADYCVSAIQLFVVLGHSRVL